jgi:hypothetical protein
MSLIQNVRQYNLFLDVLPDLDAGEVYFVSLSARNKYLTPFERDFFGLGRTEMFARTIVRSKDKWAEAMRLLEGEAQTRQTKNGFVVPQKALVTYVNINPSSSVDAYMLYTEKMNGELSQALRAERTGKSANYLAFTRADRMLMDCFQNSTARIYLDIDIDTHDPEYVLTLVQELNDFGVTKHIIKTHGGYHVLILRTSLNGSGMRLDKTLRGLQEKCKGSIEIMINKNGMIPMPGTLQAEVLVTLVGDDLECL